MKWTVLMIFISALLFSGFILWRNESDSWPIIVWTGIALGGLCAIPNLNSISHVAVSVGKWLGWKIEIKQKVEEIRATAERIARIENDLRAVLPALASFIYLHLKTRGMFPVPEGPADLLSDELNRIAEFAFPDPTERLRWKEQIDEEIEEARERHQPPAG